MDVLILLGLHWGSNLAVNLWARRTGLPVSSVCHAKHVAIGVFKPRHLHRSSGGRPDAEVVLTEVWIEVESYALFAQGFHGGWHVREVEAQDGVLVRDEIGHHGDA